MVKARTARTVAAGVVVALVAFACVPPPGPIVDNPGPVDLAVTSGSVEVGLVDFGIGTCVAGACPTVTVEVDEDGFFDLPGEDVELPALELPVELLPGVTVTATLTPVLLAPAGRVVPATGAMDFSTGFAVRIGAPLLPASCAVGPVGLALAAGPGAPAGNQGYDQADGTALLAGGFTEQVAVTGCGLFTGVINDLLGLPVDLVDNEATLGVALDPVLTGSGTP